MVPAWTVWPFSLTHQKGRWENAVQPCRSGSDFLSSLVWIPQHSAQDIWIHASYFSLERKVWGLQHMMYGEAEGVGFFSLEKRRQRAGCTITYGPGVDARPVFTKMHKWKGKKRQTEAEFQSTERLLHKRVEKHRKSMLDILKTQLDTTLRDLI